MRKALLAFAFAAVSVALPACGSGSSGVSTTDPSQPYYRNPDADLAKTPTLMIRFMSVTTNNNEGVDQVKPVFLDSFKSKLKSRFTTIAEGDAAGAGEAVLEVDIYFNWGSRAGRAFGWGGGRAGIRMKYHLKDSAGGLIAKLEAEDTMAGGGWTGGDARALIFAAADKWNSYFAKTILAPKGAPEK